MLGVEGWEAARRWADLEKFKKPRKLLPRQKHAESLSLEATEKFSIHTKKKNHQLTGFGI